MRKNGFLVTMLPRMPGSPLLQISMQETKTEIHITGGAHHCRLKGSTLKCCRSPIRRKRVSFYPGLGISSLA